MLRRIGVLACVGAALCVQLALAGPAAASWSRQDSGTTQHLRGVSCPSVTQCWTVGTAGTIRSTADGGRSGWGGQSSGTGDQLADVSCPTVSQCWAVGGDSSPAAVIRTTSNGGVTPWTGQNAGVSWLLAAVSCPSATTCWAGGLSGVLSNTLTAGLPSGWQSQSGAAGWTVEDISCPTPGVCFAALAAVDGTGGVLATKDGGRTWALVKSGVAGLYGISCRTVANCVAVGKLGAVIFTEDAGAHWTTGDSGTTTKFEAVACPTTTSCVADGDGGMIRTTTDGAAHWTAEPSGVTVDLYGVACPDPAECWIVGDNGTILTQTAAGECSAGKVGTPPACVDLGLQKGVPSDDCDLSPQAVVVDGYVGSLYARLRTTQSADATPGVHAVRNGEVASVGSSCWNGSVPSPELSRTRAPVPAAVRQTHALLLSVHESRLYGSPARKPPV